MIYTFDPAGPGFKPDRVMGPPAMARRPPKSDRQDRRRTGVPSIDHS
jgi:hypothetical protein